MILAPWVTGVACFYFGVARPVVAAHQRLLDDDDGWLAFFICATLLVLPLVVYVPTWIPLRDDLIVLSLIALGSFDRRLATGIYRRYLFPTAQYVDQQAHRLMGWTSEDLLDAIECVMARSRTEVREATQVEVPVEEPSEVPAEEAEEETSQASNDGDSSASIVA